METPFKFFIYARKSSEDDERQVLSIEAQIEELRDLARNRKLQVVRVFEESRSALKPGREVFAEMLQRMQAGEADGILCWALNRLARNFDEGGPLIGLLQREVIRVVHTPEKTYLPTDNVIMIALDFAMANQYSRDLSRDIRRGIREKVRRGVYSGKAPIGYFNDPLSRTIEPHPINFQKMKRMLELFTTGNYSLTAIQREMAAVGLVGNRTKKPLHLATIGNLLQNPFYYGVFSHKGEMHQGTHPPMISKGTFDDIQKALVVVGKPRNRNTRGEKGFLFLNFALCSCCGSAITAERHVKKSGLRFDYYRCTRKNKNVQCQNRKFSTVGMMKSEIRRNVELVALSDEWKERFLAKVESWEAADGQETRRLTEHLRQELAKIKSALQRVNTAFTEGHLDIDEFKEVKNPLVPKKVEIERKLVALQTSQTNRLEPLRNWILEANAAKNLLFSENWLEMKSFLKKVGSNRLLSAGILSVQFKKPWNSLAEMNLTARSAAEDFLTNSNWWSRGESNP